jgi:hypothetical protein
MVQEQRRLELGDDADAAAGQPVEPDVDRDHHPEQPPKRR